MAHFGKLCILTSFACVLATVSCKKQPKPQSDLQSIDTITQEQSIKNRDYDCGFRKGKPSDLGSAETSYRRVVKVEPAGDITEDRLKDFLVAVPDLLLDALSEGGGKVILKTDAVQFCMDRFKELSTANGGSVHGLTTNHVTSRAQDLKGCWYAPANGVANIYLMANEEAINDGILPLFTYHLVERLNQEIYDNALKEKKLQTGEHSRIVAASKKLSELRTKLVEALFADLVAANRQDVIKRLQGEFGLSDATTNLDGSMVEALGNMILAESVDSYYCSKESQAAFAKATPGNSTEVAFPQVYQLFTRPMDATNKSDIAMSELLGGAWHAL